MNVESMESAAADVSGTLKQLANPKRLLILCQLVGGEKTVGELAGLLQVSQVVMSQQLKLLKVSGTVSSRRQAQSMYYRIADKDVRKLVQFLYRTFCPG